VHGSELVERQRSLFGVESIQTSLELTERESGHRDVYTTLPSREQSSGEGDSGAERRYSRKPPLRLPVLPYRGRCGRWSGSGWA
jgi:hypothetical protein